MIRTVAALTALTLLGAQPPRAQQTPAPDSLRQLPWIVGEHLEFQVKFDLFNVGHAAMDVVGIDTIRGEPCYHVMFTIHAHAIFYTLNDSLQSWFGVNDLVSHRFTQDTDDNGTRRIHHYDLFPERGLWIRNGTDSGETVADPLDDASFFFFARTLPFGPGETYSFPRYFIADHNPVTIRVLGRQTIRVPAGRFPAVAVRPIFKSGGMFSQGGEAIIWFSDDSLHIPLKIRTSMVVGTLEINLRSRN
ncbi:MAG: DUF3108 domain-containing protein [Gemmatimonadales bacterium]